MKKSELVLGLAILVMLAGCGAKNSASKHTNKESKVSSQQSAKMKTKSSSSKTDKSTKTTEKVLWSAKKAKALKTYMATFSQSMSQEYVEYQPGNDVNFFGLKYPTEFKKNQVAVNNQQVSVNWSDDGTGSNDYNVVAIYSDAATTEGMSKHLYLFTFHQEKPVVLITQQNQGMPDNLVHFDATENEELSSHFDTIVSGKDEDVAKTTETPKAGYQVPKELVGTWYGYSKYSEQPDQIDVMTIKGNLMTTNGVISSLHTDSERTPADRAALHSDGGAVPDPAKENWGVASPLDQEGRIWLNIRGWYQSAGDGTYYSVKERNINGKMTPVLTEASGAGIWSEMHYYSNKETAISMGETRFDDEHYNDN